MFAYVLASVPQTPAAEVIDEVTDLRADPVWSVWVVVALGVVLAGLAVWSYVRTTRPVGPGLRALLLGLRFGAIGVCVLVLLRPACVTTQKKLEKALLVLLYDTSRSMSIKDGPGGVSRAETVVRTTAECDEELKRLAERLEVKEFHFAAGCEPGYLRPDQEPTGPRTNIGGALRDVVHRNRGQRFVGVLLLSDGANNVDQPDARFEAGRLKSLQIPLYCVGVGQEKASARTRDIILRGIRASRAAFVNNRVPVNVELIVRKFPRVPLTVELLEGDRVVATKPTTVRRDEALLDVELSYVPEKPGTHKLTVRVSPKPGELRTDNNQIETTIQIIKGGLSVLYVEGRVRWESAFVRRALDESPDIRLDSYTLLSPAGGAQPQALDPALFKHTRYDVFIIGDTNSNRFTHEQLTGLAKAVEEGSGLLMTGGYESFGAGGYGQTPLAPVLPVRLSRRHGQIDRPIRVEPTEAGLRHYVMRMGAGGKAAWKKLLPLQGASQLGPVDRKRGQVLARGPGGETLLVAAPYGTGRVLAFAGDTTWRWYTHSRAEQVYHKRFWRQLILWLAKREVEKASKVWVKVDRRRVPLGEKVELTAGGLDGEGNVITDARLIAHIAGPGARKDSVELARQGNVYRGSYVRTDAVGDYHVTAKAERDGQLLGSGKDMFLVFSEDLELSQTRAELTFLRDLAYLAGGRPVYDLKKFLAQLDEQDLRVEFARPIVASLWDRWWWMVLFAMLVGAEWLLRKRKGLV